MILKKEGYKTGVNKGTLKDDENVKFNCFSDFQCWPLWLYAAVNFVAFHPQAPSILQSLAALLSCQDFNAANNTGITFVKSLMLSLNEPIITSYDLSFLVGLRLCSGKWSL